MVSKLPQPISKEEFDKLLESAKAQREEYWMPRKEQYKTRGKYIQQYIISMVLAFGAGMRISEIVGLNKTYTYKYKGAVKIQKCLIQPLRPEDVDKDFIRLKGAKGGKDRAVIIPQSLFRKAGIKREEFIANLPLEVSRSSIQRYVTELGIKVLNKNISFHKARHGFATFMLKQGMNIKQVQMLMGHSNVSTTSLYLHASPEEALAKVKEMEW